MINKLLSSLVTVLSVSNIVYIVLTPPYSAIDIILAALSGASAIVWLIDIFI